MRLGHVGPCGQQYSLNTCLQVSVLDPVEPFHEVRVCLGKELQVE